MQPRPLILDLDVCLAPVTIPFLDPGFQIETVLIIHEFHVYSVFVI